MTSDRAKHLERVERQVSPQPADEEPGASAHPSAIFKAERSATECMARKPRRKFRRYLPGKIDHKLQLATLAPQTALGSLLAGAVVDTTWVSSVKAIYGIGNYTAVAECGPFIAGWAHSDYSDGEIKEWLEIAGSWDAGDKIAQEKSRRQIRQIGTFEVIGTGATQTITMNDGRMLTTKLGWSLSPGDTLKFWVYNAGTAAVATTDPEVRAQGHANLWPR